MHCKIFVLFAKKVLKCLKMMGRVPQHFQNPHYSLIFGYLWYLYRSELSNFRKKDLYAKFLIGGWWWCFYFFVWGFFEQATLLLCCSLL